MTAGKRSTETKREDIVTAICMNYKYVGGWHVFSSEDLPGLYVASEDAEKAYDDVAPSIQLLIKLNEGVKVEVKLELTFREFLQQLQQKSAAEKSTARPPQLSSHRYAVSAVAYA